jgi:hypothetical protein
MQNRWLLVSLVAGCASGPATRSATEYGGEPFDLRAEPNRITGQVCGMDLDYSVERRDDGVQLTGFIDAHYPTQVHICECNGQRVIEGALGNDVGNATVDLVLTGDKLDGRVGWRYFGLRARGDELYGPVHIAGVANATEVLLAGRDQLQRLPAEVQGALLPSLLSCNLQPIGRFNRSALQVRIGGPPGALPHQSSALYTH